MAENPTIDKASTSAARRRTGSVYYGRLGAFLRGLPDIAAPGLGPRAAVNICCEVRGRL